MTPPPPNSAVVVSDAHLGAAPSAVSTAFHEFLEAVPALASHLVINGDLFDFWFEYRSVIPRTAFPTLAVLARVRAAGLKVTVTGGNHDRWGGRFWRDQLGATFHRGPAVFDLAGFRAFVAHGDGMAEQHWAGRVMHAVTRHPLTAAAFRLVHPDLGFRLVQWMSGALAKETRSGPALDRAAAAQSDLAGRMLADRSDLELVVLGHTHRAALVPVSARRWYLNPGAWIDGQHYALVTESGPELRTWPL